MNEIKVAENKTLKLTNVLSRVVRPEELASLPVILTQMQNFMKSNGAQPIGPLAYNPLATSKLQILAFENDIKLTGNSYTLYVNQDEDDGVIDVFMETK